MTNYDLYKVREGINKCAAITNVANINFAFLMAKIESELDSEIKILEKARKPFSEGYMEYLKKKRELDGKHIIQKEDGSVLMLDGNLILKNPKEYNSELAKLNEEYSTDISGAKEIMSEFENFLQNTSNARITELPKSCIPASINVEQMKLLFPVIVDK